MGCGSKQKRWWIEKERGVREREAVPTMTGCSSGNVQRCWLLVVFVLVTCVGGVGDL